MKELPEMLQSREAREYFERRDDIARQAFGPTVTIPEILERRPDELRAQLERKGIRIGS